MKEISQINIPTPTDNIDTISLYLNFLSAKNRENCKNNIYIFKKKMMFVLHLHCLVYRILLINYNMNVIYC